MPGRSKQIPIAQFPAPLPGHKLEVPIAAASRQKAMNGELTPRVYREYCWFALLLLIMTIGFVGRPPAGETGIRANAASMTSAAAAPAPPALATPARPTP
jgi:hypothetical protein